ncbi:MAG: site-2 protease family protein [Phycisphaerales bacterium]
MGIVGIYDSLGPAAAAAFLFWGIFSITMHELAHGWAALSQGDDTPRIYGRMTINPVVHMGWVSLILLALVGIAWGSMPTDPSKYRWGRRGRIIVSGAGPAMNVLLWLVCWIGFGVVVVVAGGETGASGGTPAVPGGTMRQLAQFLMIGGMLNGMLALFNMLPVPPFDGASVAAGFSRTFYRWMHNPRVAQFGFLFVLVALFSGVAGVMSSFAFQLGLALAGVAAGIAGGFAG